VRGKLAHRLHPAGSVQLDKMSETLDIFTLESVAAPRPQQKKAEPVLAVLPFDNESGDVAMEYFSEGIADEIIMTLMRQSRLKIIGRLSAFQFRDEKKSEAAAALDATHVLDGAVRCGGAKLRVSAHLIEVRSGQALWSDRYEGDRADAFALQDSVAAKVAAALKLSFHRTDRANSNQIDPAAYDLYLRARQIWLMLDDPDEEQAAMLLERCVALAPNFARGWASLASVYAFLLPRDRDMIGQPRHAAAVEAAQTALELDPDCAQAFASLALLKPGFGEYAEKLRLTDEALARSPNDPAFHIARAAWLYGVGRTSDAAAALEIASVLEPLGPAVEGLRASLIMSRGDIDTALDIISSAWARWPDSAFIWYMMWVALCGAGKLNDAEALAAPGAAPRRGVTRHDVRVLKQYVGLLRHTPEERHAAADAILSALARSTGPVPLSSCMTAARFGSAERAFDLIERAIERGRPLCSDPHVAFGMARSQSSLQLFVHNGGEPFFMHKRFPKLCARLGLAQYWIESDHWPDCAAGAAYDFKGACQEAVASL
jgi:TolB-like protein